MGVSSAMLDAESVNVSGRLERLPMTSYQRRVFAAVATAWLADQVNVALLVFLIGPLASYFNLTKVQIGLLASMTFLGQLIGNLMAGYISDRFGRRLAFQLTMLIWGLGSFLAAGATGLVTLMLFRLIIGIGVGGEAPVAQSILSEIIPADKRGFYISFMEGFWAVGFVISGLLAYTVLPILGWRGVFVAVGILSLVIFWARQIIFESPRWLVDQKRFAEADEVLTHMEHEVAVKLGRPPPAPRQYVPETSQSLTNLFRILFTRAYLRSTVMLAGLWFFALLGYFGLTSWLAVILNQHGFSIIKSIGFVSLISVGGIPGFFVAGLLLERMGRKLTTALFLVMSALLAYVYGHSISLGFLFAAGFFMQFFMFGMWCCLYAYTPELYPTRARSTGSGVASAFGRVGAILGPIAVGFLISTIGRGAVFSFGAASFVISAALVLSLGIETRGRVLEEISMQEEA